MHGIMTSYRDLLAQLRDGFPAPTSDPLHDGYMVISLLRALDKVDALKSQAPILGSPRELDFDAASQAVIADAKPAAGSRCCRSWCNRWKGC